MNPAPPRFQPSAVAPARFNSASHLKVVSFAFGFLRWVHHTRPEHSCLWAFALTLPFAWNDLPQISAWLMPHLFHVFTEMSPYEAQPTILFKIVSSVGRKEPFSALLWECKLVQLLWRAIRRSLRKLKINLPYDPTIPLLGINPEKMESQKHVHPSVHSSTIYNTQHLKTT